MGCGQQKIESSDAHAAFEGPRALLINHTALRTPHPGKHQSESTAHKSDVKEIREAPTGPLQTKVIVAQPPKSPSPFPAVPEEPRETVAGIATNPELLLQRNSNFSQSEFSAAQNRHSQTVALVKQDQAPLYFSASDGKNGSGIGLSIIPNKKRYRLETVDRDLKPQLCEVGQTAGQELTAQFGDQEVAITGRGLDLQGPTLPSLKARPVQPASNCEAGSLKSETDQHVHRFSLLPSNLKLIKMASSEVNTHSMHQDAHPLHSQTPTCRCKDPDPREDVFSSEKVCADPAAPQRSEYSDSARKRFKERQFIDNRARVLLPNLRFLSKAKPQVGSLSPGISPCSHQTCRHD